MEQRGSSLAQKILARASGRSQVSVGEVVVARVDLAVMQDSGGPRRVGPDLERLGVGLWDPDRVVVVVDHFVPGADVTEKAIVKLTRNWVKRYGVKRFHELEGICHIVPSEQGYIRPGALVVVGDSHAPTAGALGCFATALGSTDMLGVLVTGEVWLKVPASLRINWTGRLGLGVTAKDMILFNLKQLGTDGAAYMAVEFGGAAVRSLPIDERLVLTNMSAEMGAKAGMIEPDATIFDYLAAREVQRDDYAPVWADPDAAYARLLTCDASALEPLVALPHSPDNVVNAAEVVAVPVDQCYIGACTGAKYYDLALAARVLKGRKVHPDTRLLVAPASRAAMQRAASDGTLLTLIEAGATLMPSACGACAGLSGGILAAGERCISTTNRNFQGRMGHADAEVFLASAATVAASAVTGQVTDPRHFLE